MATTTAKKRPGPTPTASQKKAASRTAGKAGKTGKAGGKRVGQTAGKAASKTAGKAGLGRLGRAVALKAVKVLGRKALEATGGAVRSAAQRSTAMAREAVDSGLDRRLPIQAAIDVAVPLEVAWEEWMTFEAMTEGVHRIEEVERDGDHLFGRTASPVTRDWEAEIVDERAQQAFAWRSVEGSDCAGLATFHRLSDRLTRIELDLDVVPTGPGEAVALTVHLAHHRAQTDLRRFKARVEFINPDVYEAELNGGPPDDAAGDEDDETDD
jgi:uncharacterized membrane protein